LEIEYGWYKESISMGRTAVLIQRLPEKISGKNVRHLMRELQIYLNSDHPKLVFDMSQVEQMDSSGIEMLLDVLQEVNHRDGDLKLAAPSPAARTFLELTRLDRLFEIFDSSAEAAAAFGTAVPETAAEPALVLRQRVTGTAGPELVPRAS
jgi:anti-sigma B factor antagonist